MRTEVCKLRHWKQRFDKNAAFIWRRPTTYGDESFEAGDPIPKDLADHHTKLRRFWESKRIELAEFADRNVATGQIVRQKVYEVTDIARPNGIRIMAEGNTFTVYAPDGDVVELEGREALEELLEGMRLEAALS